MPPKRWSFHQQDAWDVLSKRGGGNHAIWALLAVESLFYLAWSLPFTGLLASKLYAPALAMPALSRGGRASVWSTTQ